MCDMHVQCHAWTVHSHDIDSMCIFAESSERLQVLVMRRNQLAVHLPISRNMLIQSQKFQQRTFRRMTHVQPKQGCCCASIMATCHSQIQLDGFIDSDKAA